MSRAKTILRAIRRGNFRFAKMLLLAMAWGLTHRFCKQCGGFKGLSMSQNCATCAVKNIRRVIFEECDAEPH